VFETLIHALETRLGDKAPPPPGPRSRAAAHQPKKEADHAELVDLKLHLTQTEYKRQLDPLQNELHLLGYQVYVQKRPVVLVFEAGTRPAREAPLSA